MSVLTHCLFPILLSMAGQTDEPAWPPALKGAVDGTITLTSDSFLEIPAAVQSEAEKPGAAPFVLAKAAPTVELALPPSAGSGRRGAISAWPAMGEFIAGSAITETMPAAMRVAFSIAGTQTGRCWNKSST